MEGRFVGNGGKRPQLDVVEKSRVSEVLSVRACIETPGGHEYILQLSGGHTSETTLQNACAHVMHFLVLWSVLPSTGLALHFSIVL